MSNDQQEAYTYQLLSQQLQQFQQQLQILEQQLEELQQLDEHLTSFKTVKKDTEGFANLGAGVYVKATFNDTETIYLTVGAGVLVPKTPDEAKELVQKQIKELEDTHQMLLQNMQGIITRLQQIEQKMQHAHAHEDGHSHEGHNHEEHDHPPTEEKPVRKRK